MLAPGKAVGFLLLLIAAGCASGPSGRRAPVSDWSSEAARPANAVPPLVSRPSAEDPALRSSVSPPPPLPAAPVPDLFAESWVPLNRWCKVNGLEAPQRVTIAPAPTYQIHSRSGVLVLRIGSHLVHWQGVTVHLGFAPQLIDGQPFIQSLDLRKTIQPLINEVPMICLSTNPVVVIDPGHGGENSGTKSAFGAYYEKDFTLDWARRLETLLIASGWQVFLTRTNNTDLALSNRVALADEHNASLFLSLHFNSAAPSQTQEGLETYCLTPAGMPSTVTRGFGDDATLVFPNNAFDEDNLQMAYRVHRALLEVNGNHDRGVRRARFLGVLRGQHRPAILIEGGYLSNPKEARMIADPMYRQQLAEAITRGLSRKADAGEANLQVASQRAKVRAPDNTRNSGSELKQDGPLAEKLGEAKGRDPGNQKPKAGSVPITPQSEISKVTPLP